MTTAEREELRRLRRGNTELQASTETLKDFGVQRLCEALGVARSGYYTWQVGPRARADRASAEAVLVSEVHDQTRGAYGVPRVHAELRAQGRMVNRKRIARLMPSPAATCAKRCRTTVQDRSAARAGPDRTRLHRERARCPMGRRHHVSAGRGLLDVPGDRHRPALTAPGGLVAGRSHAHWAGRRCAGGRGGRPRWPGRRVVFHSDIVLSPGSTSRCNTALLDQQ